MTRTSPATTPSVLVINPNTNPDVTAGIAKAVASLPGADRGAEVIGATDGPFAIETPADRARAVPHVLELVRGGAARGCRGYVMACFDDIAVAEARALVAGPVISLAEAGIRDAAARHARFAVVTTAQSAVAGINALIKSYGLQDRCFVMATGVGVAETAARTVRAEAALTKTILACADRSAEGIVLGSGAYAGRAGELSARLNISITDGLDAALRFASG